MNFRARILVVDDRNENRLLVTRILNQQDYEVITAASGLEALQFLEHDPNIDVMLLDMMMPDLKGFEVLEAIQTNPHTSRIKVIMFSAMGQVEDKVKAFESGAADYIVKPFNRIELLARIELQLKLSRIEKELSTERNLLRLLIDNLPDLIYVKDIHSRFVAANVALAKIIGVATPAELIGQTDFDFFLRQLASQYYADEQTLIRTGQSLQAREEPVVDATGRSGWILTTKVPLTDTSGNVFGLVGIGRDITERKHIEETLQQNEELLSNIIESMGDGILVLDTQFRYTYWNRAMEEISKVSRREVIGNEQAPWEIFPRLIERGVDKAMRRAMQGETIHLREIPSYFKDGSSEFTSEIYIPLKTGTGEIRGVLGVIRDVTERKLAVEQLRDSEAKFRKITEAAQDAIIMVDQQDNISLWNTAAERIFGYTPEEAIGQELHSLIAPQRYHQAFQQAFGQVKTTKRGAPIGQMVELTAMRRDGTEFPVELSLSSVKLKGNWNGMAIIRDITERKAAEESLRKLSRAVEQSASMIVITDRHGTIEFVNPRFLATTGYSSKEAIGQNPRILKSGKHPPEFYKDLWDTITRGEVWQGELLNKKKNGDLYWESATISPVKGESGKLTHFVAVKEDITRRKHMEVELRLAKEAAEAATKAKSAFLANMSHEIRTPMNGVIGMTSLLLDTDLTPQQRDFVEIIRTSGDALLTIINDILDFSKIEAGKLELEYQPFQLRPCLEEALDLVAPKAAEKGLNLAYVLDNNLPEAFEGDVTRVRQILVNLLSNAVKFTETGEVAVTVTGEQQANSGKPSTAALGEYNLHFAVRDTGIGIPKDRLPRLFRSFSQVDTSTTRRYGGTGLGLAISKHLSEMMGGTIWAESKAGQGSTFHFTITAKAASSQQFQYLRMAQPSLLDKRVLIVDDHETNRRILAHQTESWGMQPTVTASGPQALALIDQNVQFDLVILDMQMPDMDGLTLAVKIRQHRAGQGVPLIMLSSLGQPEPNGGVVDFAATLSKPIKPSQLYNVLVGVVANQPKSAERAEPAAALSKFDRHIGQNHPLRILLAEDNAVNQKVALSILARLGYRADLAANGLEVLEALRRQPYDVVLMDIQMPEMDGLTATGHIRQEWEQAQQPHIIAMTANALQGDREKFLAAGMDDYVSKPVQVQELTAALRKCQPRFSLPTEAAPRLKTEPHGSSIAPQPLSQASNGKDCVSPTSKPAIIDQMILQKFQAQLGQDGSMIMAELITLFLTDAPKLLAQLQQGLAHQDIEVVQRAAHTLKSNSATFGASELSALCAELESQAKAGSISGAEEKVQCIGQAFNQAEMVLKHYVASGS